MSDRLCSLMKMIVWSLPVKDPHAQQRQQRQIVDLCPIHHMKPFSPADHMGPQLVIEEQVWEDVVPPLMVCGCLILPLFVDPMKGVLGDLQKFSSVFL